MTSIKKADYEGYRTISEKEIVVLTAQGCRASDWRTLFVTDSGFDPYLIRNVNFHGVIHIGANVTLENIQRLEYTPGARCGIGTRVAVLDETGSRSVPIFPGLSSQIATLYARVPEWAATVGQEIAGSEIAAMTPFLGIGDNCSIRNCNLLVNVSIDHDVNILGALSLMNGCIINNAPQGHEIAHIGYGVMAENFIVEDGVLDSRATVKNCYIGQGAALTRGFSAHDSIFFTNCAFENGECCAVLAGPFTVSMHKSSLLIGCQTSFFNAGSGTNQSNHMYKLGPVHCGILERGVKTSSDSYLMLGARIGAFSLLMGQHKSHPDSSSFPFSYLFGDERGSTVVVPGAMLHSCGLLRDEKKWMDRDCRPKHRLKGNDLITFEILNPSTIEGILKAIDTIDQLVQCPPDDDRYIRCNGMKITRSSLHRARHLYTLAVYKFLSIVSHNCTILCHNSRMKPQSWTDLGGMLITRENLEHVMRSYTLSGIRSRLSLAYNNYDADLISWVAARLDGSWSRNKQEIMARAAEFDAIMAADRAKAENALAQQNEMLAL